MPITTNINIIIMPNKSFRAFSMKTKISLMGGKNIKPYAILISVMINKGPAILS